MGSDRGGMSAHPVQFAALYVEVAELFHRSLHRILAEFCVLVFIEIHKTRCRRPRAQKAPPPKRALRTRVVIVASVSASSKARAPQRQHLAIRVRNGRYLRAPHAGAVGFPRQPSHLCLHTLRLLNVGVAARRSSRLRAGHAAGSELGVCFCFTTKSRSDRSILRGRKPPISQQQIRRLIVIGQGHPPLCQPLKSFSACLGSRSKRQLKTLLGVLAALFGVTGHHCHRVFRSDT